MNTIIPKKSTCTSKRVRYVGKQEYLNCDTGEIEQMNVTSVEERDFNFTKVFMRDFLFTLDNLGNKKLKVCTYIMENITRDSYFIGTVRGISDTLNISIQTVYDTVKILLESNFMKRIGNGIYRINADIIFKGTHKNRMKILHEYHSVPAKKVTREEKIANLKKSLAKMQAELEKLEKGI